MTNFARIINDVAVDVSDSPYTSFPPDFAGLFVTVPDEVRPQWRFDGESWVPPADIPAAHEAASPRIVMQIAFRKRIGLTVETIIYAAAQTDAEVAALIGRLGSRDVVNLASPDTSDGLAVLVGKQLMTEQHAAMIVSGPIQPEEMP